MLSEEFIRRITRRAKPEFQQGMVDNMNQIFEIYEINTPLRIAHFLAQAMHESGEFSINTENLNYSAPGLMRTFPRYFPDSHTAEQYARKPEMIANRVYSNRMGNGNEASGDGWRYRGRGIFQLTGKDNYTRYGNAIGIDLINDPEAAYDPVISLQVACEYWKSRNMNPDADHDDIVMITKKINGGTIGLDDRKHHFHLLYPQVEEQFNV